MIRALPALIVIALLIAISVFIADRPGSVELEWQNWRIDTSVSVLALGVGAVAMLAAALFHLLRKFITAPWRLSRWRRERRREAGYRALTQGMVAIAAGDPSEALKYARRADVLLAEPPLTLLLSAQAAQLNGDQLAAQKYFTAMLERPETEFLGLRGLLMQALHAGDDNAGLKLVERAKQLRPRTPWVLTQLYELQARGGHWREAEATLAEAIKRKAVGETIGRRHRAALLHEESRAAEASGDTGAALTFAGKAFAADPGFAPGAVRLAGLHLTQGHRRRALRTLLSAWRQAPHPDIAHAYDALFQDETAVQRVKRVEHLAAANPSHRESHLALAEAALAAKLWGEARRHLTEAGAAEPSATPQMCRLMAQIEEQEHGDYAAARAWLARAADSSAADPTYVCEKCGAETGLWSALCLRCRAFGSLVWRMPPRSKPALPAPAGVTATPATLINAGQPRLVSAGATRS
jgi:HemY protein